jgi:hypothetical protein
MAALQRKAADRFECDARSGMDSAIVFDLENMLQPAACDVFSFDVSDSRKCAPIRRFAARRNVIA